MNTLESLLKRREQQSKITNAKMQKGIIAGVVVIGMGVIGWGVIKKVRKSNTEKKAAEDPNVGQAMFLRIAMNPSGMSWMMSFDSTDEKEIFRIADTITDLNAVASAYKKMYNSSLYSDLQKELDSSDYQRFLQLSSKNTNNQNPIHSENNIQTMKWCLTSKDVNVRTSPQKIGTHTWQIGDNIITKLSGGKVIGMATGKQVYDADNDVVFTEIKATKKDKTTFNVYAWKGGLDFLSKEELNARFNQNIPLAVFD